MRGSLYANPAFASGVSNMLASIFPSARETAATELTAAQAGLANDERGYRAAIGTAGQSQDLAGLLTAALQAGEGGAAPGIASSLASLPQYGLDQATQGRIQVGTGTQAASGTFTGLGQTLGNTRTLQRDKFAHEDRQAAAGNAAFQSALGSLLIDTESGGNFGAQNSEVGHGGQVGHFGRAQFGIARLEDAKRAGVIPASISPDQFLANPDMQVRAEAWHRGDILSQAQANGTYSLIGSTVKGIPVTEEGLVNVAHLGGAAGAKRFFETGGAYDPADANGTRLSDYLAKGARQGGGATPAAQPGGLDPRMIAMLMAAGNPNMTGPQSNILGDLADMLQPDAADPFTLGRARYDGAGNLIAREPEKPFSADGMPTSVEEYEYAKAQGYEGTLLDWQREKGVAGRRPVAAADPRNLSAGGRTMLMKALGEDVDPATAMMVAAQAEALLADPAMTETEALSYALDNLERGPDVVEDGWFSDTTTPGKITGVKPREVVEGIGQPGAAAMPAPKSAAEMQALPSGTKFLAPDGTIRIKP
jgi:hypothetical protein